MATFIYKDPSRDENCPPDRLSSAQQPLNYSEALKEEQDLQTSSAASTTIFAVIMSPKNLQLGRFKGQYIG
jgi:hypothetical protein